MVQGGSQRLIVRGAAVWLVMIAVLVLVPDALEGAMPLPIARAVGWVLASAIWVALLDREWRERFAPLPRFLIQLAVWLSAALIAVFISDYFRMGRGDLL